METAEKDLHLLDGLQIAPGFCYRNPLLKDGLSFCNSAQGCIGLPEIAIGCGILWIEP
jgi:hypothetical protein